MSDWQDVGKKGKKGKRPERGARGLPQGRGLDAYRQGGASGGAATAQSLRAEVLRRMREDPNYNEERYIEEIKQESYRREMEVDEAVIQAVRESLLNHTSVDEQEQLEMVLKQSREEALAQSKRQAAVAEFSGMLPEDEQFKLAVARSRAIAANASRKPAAMSRGGSSPRSTSGPTPTPPSPSCASTGSEAPRADGPDEPANGDVDEDLALAIQMSMMAMEAPPPTTDQTAKEDDEDEEELLARLERESEALEEERRRRRAEEEEREWKQVCERSVAEASSTSPARPATTPSPSYRAASPARPSAPSPLVLPAGPVPSAPSPALVYSDPSPPAEYASPGLVDDDQDPMVEALLQQTAMEYQRQHQYQDDDDDQDDDYAEVLEKSRKEYELELGRDLTREEEEMLRRAEEESRRSKRDEERRRAMLQDRQQKPAKLKGPAWGARNEWVEEIEVKKKHRKALPVLRGEHDNQLERIRVEKNVEVTIVEDDAGKVKVVLRGCRSRMGSELSGDHRLIEEMDNVMQIMRAEVDQTLREPQSVLEGRTGHNLHVFIDWSNIVLGAKTSGRSENTRVDPARFIALITADRDVQEKFVAGSSGRTFADQWPIFEALGWKIYREGGGKEVQVDTKLQLKMSSVIHKKFKDSRHKIILCTGDGNFKDEDGYDDNSRESFPGLVEQALAAGFMVELYSWEQATSQHFKRFLTEADYSSRMKIVYLDKYRSYLCKDLHEEFEMPAGHRGGSASPSMGGRSSRTANGRSPLHGSSPPANSTSPRAPSIPAFSLLPPAPSPEPPLGGYSTAADPPLVSGGFSLPQPPALARPAQPLRPIGTASRPFEASSASAVLSAYSAGSSSSNSGWSSRRLDARSAAYQSNYSAIGSSRAVGGGGGGGGALPSFQALNGLPPPPPPVPPGFYPPTSTHAYGTTPYAAAPSTSSINGMTVMGTPGFMPAPSMVGGGAFYSSGPSAFQAGLTMPTAAPPSTQQQQPQRPSLYEEVDRRRASGSSTKAPAPPGFEPAPAPAQAPPPPVVASAAPPTTQQPSNKPPTPDPNRWKWDG